METGIHYQAAGTERERLEIAEASDVVGFVGAQLVGKLLCIEGPPLRVRIEGEHLPNERHLVRVFTLPDVPWYRLVEGQVRQAVFAVQIGRPQIDPESARNLPVDR